MTIFQKTIYILLLSSILLMPSINAYAVNWLMLQGTEAKTVTHRPVIFAQPSYTRDLSNEISVGENAGKRAVPATIAPWFDDNDAFHFRRARAGVRGNFTGIMNNKFTGKLNYFVLLEFAQNLFNYDFLGDRAHSPGIDHLSITSNHISGARLRFGLFKTPGLEETYMGVIGQDYIEFTNYGARESLEVFATGNTRVSHSGGTNGDIGTPVTQSKGFNAARDWGIQVFESFKRADWDYSYAFMLGRGAGIHESKRSQDPLEQYFYLSAEQDLPGGKGANKHSIKYYTFLQKGVRVFDSDPLRQEYDRTRYGISMRSQGYLFGLKARQRFEVALMAAEGMISMGPTGGVKGGKLMFAAEDGNRSRAISVDYGFFVAPKVETMIRWDRHESLYKTDNVVWTEGDARNINTITYGIQYFFSAKLKLLFNYIQREITAPNEDNLVVQDVVGSIGNRYSFQLFWIY